MYEQSDTNKTLTDKNRKNPVVAEAYQARPAAMQQAVF